jgi:predicted kinase
MEACLETEQRIVIDNTNPTRQERALYIPPARLRRYTITGYYFQAKVADCLRRNSQRPEGQRVPDVAILSAAKKLEIPSLEEGFDKLRYVRLGDEGFVVEEWRDDV